jgi:RNA-directed DNA polymerase
MMNERGKSDKLVQPEKSPNKVEQSTAEGMEGRGLAKGNSGQQNASRTLRRNDAPSALERVRQAAKGNKEMRFTALFHHIYDPEMLRWAYFQLKKQAAPGIDGETWQHYPKFVTARPNSAIFDDTSVTSLVFAIADSEKAM